MYKLMQSNTCFKHICSFIFNCINQMIWKIIMIDRRTQCFRHLFIIILCKEKKIPNGKFVWNWIQRKRIGVRNETVFVLFFSCIYFFTNCMRRVTCFILNMFRLYEAMKPRKKNKQTNRLSKRIFFSIKWLQK